MKTIRLNDKGNDVKKWQFFLIGQGYLTGIADGIFGPKTDAASKKFQKKYGLVPDGIVGNKTIGYAMTLGFGVIEMPGEIKELDPNFPPLPDFTYLNSGQKHQLFGRIVYQSNPSKSNPEAIKITNNWIQENITSVTIPQLIGVKGAPETGRISFHKKGVPQLLAMWSEWEKAGLLPLVLSYAGSWVPRFISGSRTVLSSHAWGTAVDINVPWNGLGVVPAYIGKKGSVRELVPIAHKYGFYWGGHFKNRPDGMHFELAKII